MVNNWWDTNQQYNIGQGNTVQNTGGGYLFEGKDLSNTNLDTINLPGAAGGVGANTVSNDATFWDNMKSGVGVGAAVGKLGLGLWGAYQGKKALDLAEDQFNEQKQQYAQNYAAQQKTTNALMEQKAKNRYLADPRNNLTADQYMKEHGV